MRLRKAQRPSRESWRRWLQELDPSSPRRIDYVVGAVLFLLLALLYVGERNYAFELNRRAFSLEERLVSLQGETDLLMSRVTVLADRERIIRIATEQLGLIAPDPVDIEYIYFVPTEKEGRSDEPQALSLRLR